MTSNHSAGGDDAQRAASIHREVLQLAALMVIAVAAFFLTRAVAANNRDMSLRDAGEWYRRGQQAMTAGDVRDAVDAFRRATARNRTDKTYVLALARALALSHDDAAARTVLLTLRDAAPEDADVNLELARLAAQRQDVTEALRFYHNALYAPWPLELADNRRRVRFELIRFLLTHNQSSRAGAELLAASSDLPDRPDAHLEVAQLFAEAADYDHALQQFQQVLRLDGTNGAAMAGAGRAAFQLGNYALARTYLRRAPSELDDVANTRQVADLVLSRDPLAKRLGSLERRRRLMADFTYVRERLMACAGQGDVGRVSQDDMALQREAEAFDVRLKVPGVLDQDTVEEGVDLVYRIAARVTEACGPPTPLDRALVLIGRQYVGEMR